MSTVDPSLRGQTLQEPILQAITARLIGQIEDYNDQNCFISDQAIPITLPGGRIACTVSVGSGRFPNEFFAGGGADTLTEDGSIVITPMLVINLDRPRRASRKIVDRDDQTKGLLYYKWAILRALFSHPWEPTRGEQPLLRDMLSPISCDDPQDAKIGETVATVMKMRISTVFDWRLDP
jgi:hypothetical protein